VKTKQESIYFVKCPRGSILDALRLEEALLRVDDRQFCLVTHGVLPAIVLGISGKVEELVDEERAERLGLPLIRRFSGGGTVVVDEETIFFTLIGGGNWLPKELLKFTETLLRPVFPPFFSLRENDYVFDDKKVGGNAQYLAKNRFLHHTSFLYDFSPERMACLKHPVKEPIYRAGRAHKEFITTLKPYFPIKEIFDEKLEEALTVFFKVERLCYEEIKDLVNKPHRKGSVMVKQGGFTD
jgi:lipoate-protein ligase A